MASGSPNLDRPLLKVSRPIAACSRCRSAKIKCDGKLPACSACERAGKSSSCLNNSDEFARGKERSYVASLEAYCERLERQIDAARRRQQGASYSAKSPSPEDQPATIPPVRGISDRAERQEESDIDDLVGDFGFLSVNATSRDFYGISSSTSFAGLLLAVAATKSIHRPAASRSLPLRPRALPFIQHYFDHIYTTTPFLPETKFWASVDAVYQENGRFSTSFDHWALRMVLAIAAASMSHSYDSQNHEFAMSQVSAALEYAEDVLSPGSVAGIQSILLLTQYSMFDPEHFNTWYLIGIAARVAVDLGIHQEQVSDAHLDRLVLDARRKAFRCVHSLDRYVSTALGRALSFSDDSVNVPLPPAANSPQINMMPSDCNLFPRDIQPALRLFELRSLLSESYQLMFFSARKPEALPQLSTLDLCSTARGWFDKVAQDLPNHVSIQYKLELLFTLVTFLSPSNMNPRPSIHNRILLFEYAVDFILQLHNLIHKSSSLPLIITYIDLERAFRVSAALIDTLHSSYREVLHPVLPVPPIVPLGATSAPPPLSDPRQQDNPRRALACIFHTLSIFEYGRKRFNTRSLLDKFVQKSEHIKTLLEREHRQYDAQTNGSAMDHRWH